MSQKLRAVSAHNHLYVTPLSVTLMLSVELFWQLYWGWQTRGIVSMGSVMSWSSVLAQSLQVDTICVMGIFGTSDCWHLLWEWLTFSIWISALAQQMRAGKHHGGAGNVTAHLWNVNLCSSLMSGLSSPQLFFWKKLLWVHQGSCGTTLQNSGDRM